MTKHRAINTAIGLLIFIGVSAVLLGGTALDDRGNEWAESQALADAQKAAQLEARTERAAQQLCVRIKGPNAAHRWTASGELICTSNKGQGAVSVAKAAL